jgi:hypothetical protein
MQPLTMQTSPLQPPPTQTSRNRHASAAGRRRYRPCRSSGPGGHRTAARLCLLGLLLAGLAGPAALAETRWYRIEVLAFTQYAGTREQPLRPLPTIPDDARTLLPDAVRPRTLGQLELMHPVAEVRAPGQDDLGRWIDALEHRTHAPGINGRLAEIGEWQPPRRPTPPNPAVPIDPVVAAEIAEAERIERERKAKLAQSRPFDVPPAWAWRPLPAFVLQLRQAAARLAAKEGHAPLLHRAWLQPVTSDAGGTPVLLQGDAPDVQALAQLRGGEVPVLALSVWRTATAPTATPAVHDETPRAVGALLPLTRMRASVRASSGRTYYLDGPGIGALVRVDFVNRDIADELSGL